ncbi:MAG: FAD-dependent oxidoreductase [Desulfobacterales bacterium]|nr:FAD-dependent oxidoreductase [Desulfobacterales bacterium]
MNFLVIGGDAAGMSAASRAKRHRPDLDVTVLEKTADVSYSACGMPYNIADPDRSIEDLVVRRAEVFRDKQGIDLRTGIEATAIDPAARTVSTRDTDDQVHIFNYDKLLIATGAVPIKPDIPGIDQPGVMVLKSLAHGRALKDYIDREKVRQTVIIGMGYIALEMCEALRERGIGVAMVKPRPTFLPWMEATLADAIKTELEAQGVAVHLGHAVEGIEAADGRMTVKGPDLALEADLVLVAVGITPASELAAAAGLQTSLNAAIAVDARQRTSDSHIYAAGDCADAFHAVTGKRTWIPLALRANRAGWAVADNVCGIDRRLAGIVGSAVFKVFDFQVARTGLNVEEARAAGFEAASVTIKSRSRAHAHPGSSTIHVHMVGDRGSGRLLGVQMVGRDGVAHRLHAPAVALHAHMSVEQFSQADLGYAPPFGPTWDPMLTAANQLLKKL